jgi:hypothetical protein
MSARISAWWPRFLPLLVSLGGCQPEMSPLEEASLGAQEADIRIVNSLTTQALVLNALTTNPTANAMLGTSALGALFHPQTGSPYIRQQLLDVDAQQVMGYLASCALSETQSLSWKHPVTGAVSTWPGKLGLCSSWYDTLPSQECLSRVSACMVARNNALGRRVELSLRGEVPGNPDVFKLEPKTLPAQHDPDTAQRVASFHECATPGQGVGRNCGWSVDYIGKCEPGEQVRLGAGGVPPDQCVDGRALGMSTGSRMMMRVCSGISGCDNNGPRYLTQSEGSCGGTAPAVSFTCPAQGYFNVMKAPWSSTQSGTIEVDLEPETPAKTAYALSEQDAFTVREGAFYGTIFDPDALAVTVEVINGDLKGKSAVVTGAVYLRMYSCHDAEWDAGLANATHRVCASPEDGLNCAATVTGTCVAALGEDGGADEDVGDAASVCATSDGSLVEGDGDYQLCSDPDGVAWEQAVTVFLNAPCDLMPASTPDLCVRTPQIIP